MAKNEEGVHPLLRSTKDQVQEAVLTSLMEDLAPLVEEYVPAIRARMLEDKGFIGDNDVVIIGRNANDEFNIVKIHEDYITIKYAQDIPEDKRSGHTIDLFIHKAFGGRISFSAPEKKVEQIQAVALPVTQGLTVVTQEDGKADQKEELWAKLMKDLLPRIKKFIPMIRRQLTKDKDFLGSSELLMIGRNSKGDFDILKIDENFIDITMSENIPKDKISGHSIDMFIDQVFPDDPINAPKQLNEPQS